MFKIQGLVLPILLISGLGYENVEQLEEKSQIVETYEEESDAFYDETLRGSVVLSRLVKGEMHKSYKLPMKKSTVFAEPEGQSLGYQGGKRNVYISFGEFSGSSKTFQVSYTYSGINHKANISYKTGSTKNTGSLYSAPLPVGSGLWKFQFILKYETTPTKTDVYKYGVYQYSTMRYTHQYSRSHRWYRA